MVESYRWNHVKTVNNNGFTFVISRAMDASTDGEALAGKALLVGIQAFLQLDAMGPFLGSLEQVTAIRKMYVSPGSTLRKTMIVKLLQLK
jgi:hypothetical protein